MVATRRGVRVCSPSKTNSGEASGVTATPASSRRTRGATDRPETPAQPTQPEEDVDESCPPEVPQDQTSAVRRRTRASKLCPDPAYLLHSTHEADVSESESCCSAMSDAVQPSARRRGPRKAAGSSANQTEGTPEAASRGPITRRSTRRTVTAAADSDQPDEPCQPASEAESCGSGPLETQRVTRSLRKSILSRPAAARRPEDAEELSEADSCASSTSGRPGRGGRSRQTKPIPIHLDEEEVSESSPGPPGRRTRFGRGRAVDAAAASDAGDLKHWDSSDGFESGPGAARGGRYARTQTPYRRQACPEPTDSESELTGGPRGRGTPCSSRTGSGSSRSSGRTAGAVEEQSALEEDSRLDATVGAEEDRTLTMEEDGEEDVTAFDLAEQREPEVSQEVSQEPASEESRRGSVTVSGMEEVTGELPDATAAGETGVENTTPTLNPDPVDEVREDVDVNVMLLESTPADEEKTILTDEEKTTPADDGKSTPADVEKSTPADDEMTPADDEKSTPADDEKSTPADDEKTTPADDEKTPADDEKTTPAEVSVSPPVPASVSVSTEAVCKDAVMAAAQQRESVMQESEAESELPPGKTVKVIACESSLADEEEEEAATMDTVAMDTSHPDSLAEKGEEHWLVLSEGEEREERGVVVVEEDEDDDEEEEMESTPVQEAGGAGPDAPPVTSSQQGGVEESKVTSSEEGPRGSVTVQKSAVVSLLESSEEEEEEDEEEEDGCGEEEEEDHDDEDDVVYVDEEQAGLSQSQSQSQPVSEGVFVIDTRPGLQAGEGYYQETGGEEAGGPTAEEKDKEEFIDEEDDDGEDDDDNALFTIKNPAMAGLSSRIDPGLRARDLGGLYISFGGGQPKKSVTSGGQSKSVSSIVEEVMKKSVIGPEFEKKEAAPPYSESKQALKLKRKEERKATTGDGWFNMRAPELTEELKGDLKALKMRSAMDPKRFYKKNDRDGFPKYFQMGTVVDSPVDFYHSRVPKKERKRTMVEELLVDAEFRHNNKKKYQQIMTEKAAMGAGRKNRKKRTFRN